MDAPSNQIQNGFAPALGVPSSPSQVSDETRALVKQVDDLITALSGELTTAANPQRVALGHLGISDLGWTREPYHEEAFAIWHDRHKQDPGDLVTAHHLAIMYHARAIDLETSAKPAEADASWQKALELWRQLWEADSFWERIADAACKNEKRTVVRQLRQEFPRLLLQINYDLMLAPGTKNYRARYQRKLVLESGFPASAIDEVRSWAYRDFISEVPKNVWQTSVLEPSVIRQGTDRILEFLDLDPSFLTAIEDALQLQVRILRAWMQELQAVGRADPAQRKELLQKFVVLGDEWHEYMNQVVEVAGQRDDDVRFNLSRWHRWIGDALCALDREPEALRYYERGKRSSHEDEEEYRRCAKELGATHAYVARERASQDARGTQSYCDEIREHQYLSLYAHFLLANAYNLLGNFDDAEALCRAGLAVEVASTDIDELEAATRDQKRLMDMLEAIKSSRAMHQAKLLLEKAIEEMKASRFRAALTLLNQAREAAREQAAIYLLRAQCHLALDDTGKAKADLDQFRKLDDSPEGAKAARELGETIREKAETDRKFGAKALRMRSEASTALGAERYEQAADLLRQALEACPQPGQATIKSELSIVLAQWAISDVNSIMGEARQGSNSPLGKLLTSLPRLEEAVRLDSNNHNAVSSLRTLREILSKIS